MPEEARNCGRPERTADGAFLQLWLVLLDLLQALVDVAFGASQDERAHGATQPRERQHLAPCDFHLHASSSAAVLNRKDMITNPDTYLARPLFCCACSRTTVRVHCSSEACVQV